MNKGRIAAMAIVLAAGSTAAQPARAEWLKATSRHFVIYSDTDRAAVTALATRLESVDAAMRAISRVDDPPEAAANPVTVHVLDSTGAIQKLFGQANIAGFYLPRASGAVAFTPRLGNGDGSVDPQIVLFHEYAHHFLLSTSSTAYPAWLSEGYAEFVSTAKVEADGVLIGVPARHRSAGLNAATDKGLSLATLFEPKPRMTALEQEAIYGRGWLLTHYLLLNPERKPQLFKYLAALNAGVPPLKAATDSFGDLGALDRTLKNYLRKRSLAVAKVGRDRLPAIKVDVRPLTPGERALIDMRRVSTRGVDLKAATALHARAAVAAAPHPTDAVAQGWLAEMAYDAAKDDEAEAAADRALAADPASVQALLYKARVRLRRASKAGGADPQVWAEARSWIIKANRVDPNGAAALELFHHSFEMAKAKPVRSAAVGVHRALELAPQDPGLRLRSVRQHLADGEVTEARRALRPLAFSPHGGASTLATRLLALLDGGAAGPAALDTLAAEQKAAADKARAAQ